MGELEFSFVKQEVKQIHHFRCSQWSPVPIEVPSMQCPARSQPNMVLSLIVDEMYLVRNNRLAVTPLF